MYALQVAIHVCDFVIVRLRVKVSIVCNVKVFGGSKTEFGASHYYTSLEHNVFLV